MRDGWGGRGRCSVGYTSTAALSARWSVSPCTSLTRRVRCCLRATLCRRRRSRSPRLPSSRSVDPARSHVAAALSL